ncbi:hypothetical protein MKX03_001491 [Papaver bracteatum]|nr:hypothetical protein MKX03_001491 [Papaver bracteatum]
MTGSSSRKTTRSRIKSTNNNVDEDDNNKDRKSIKKNRNGDPNSIKIMKINLKYLLVYHLIQPNEGEKQVEKLRVIIPFPAPKIMDLIQFQGDHKESFYWGTYRPHVYLGIRSRTPRSLIAGLMWIGVKDGRYVMRHICEDSDELSKYGWTHHNGRDYGRLVMVDHGMTLTTDFLKVKGDGCGYGGDWAVRIDAQHDKSKLEEELWDIGDWELHTDSADNMEIHYSGFRTPHFHNLTELVLGTLGAHARRVGLLQLPDSSDKLPNVLVFQISAKFPFRTDIAFSITGTPLSSKLIEKQRDFEDKYVALFNLTDKVEPESATVGRAAIGNLLGGIGYFYGIALTQDLSYGEDFVSYWPAELYTAVPSRSFFPRGFLWDEGFHQLLICRWDIQICLDIIGHWLDLMNIDGWIPREQILGAEARSKVPNKFIPQHPTNGNPPTLFLALHDLVRGTSRNKFTTTEIDEISSFLERAFVRLEAWFQWFNNTQSGKDVGSYYWHGRDQTAIRELNPKTLSSGLDDYPRASHPTEEKRHLDLRCWMLRAADCMSSITVLLGKQSDLGKEYQSTANLLSNFELLNQWRDRNPLYDDVAGAYFDFGNHSEKVHLTWRQTETLNRNHARRELIRAVTERPQLRLVPHIGYGSPILGKQLDHIFNRSTLWTDYGLLSLAKSSTLYMKRNTEHDPPYWRGPIWMNMNYMILSALHHYSLARTIYSELRQNLISLVMNHQYSVCVYCTNVVDNYFKTGYLWGQYDQKKKRNGKGARLFTGWTSLVLLIMAAAYPEI